MKVRQWLIVACGAAVFVTTLGYLANKARADGIPQGDGALTYRGVLVKDGTRQTGTHLFGASLLSPGGTELCAFANTSMTLTDGAFSLPLPTTCLDAIRSEPDVTIEVRVDGTALPRAKLGAVPYAVEAARASSAAGALKTQLVPSGAVVAFDADSCPTGWTALATAAGRTIIGTNPGANGLSVRKRGDQVGSEIHTLTIGEMPSHSHKQVVANQSAYPAIDGDISGAGQGADHHATATSTMNAGSNQPHNNMQPSLALLYCRKD